MDEISQQIAQWLKKTRQKKGQTLPQLAHLAGLSHSSLSRIETGSSAVTLFTLARIFHAYSYTYTAIYQDLDLPAWKPPALYDRELLDGIDEYPSFTIPDIENFILLSEKKSGQAFSLISRLIDIRSIEAIRKRSGSLSEYQDLVYLFHQYHDDVYKEYPPLSVNTHRRIYLSGGALTLPDIGAYVKGCRLAQDLSLRQLAEEVGISHSGLLQFEKVMSDRVKVADLINLDKALGLDGELLAFAWRAAELYTGVMRIKSQLQKGVEPPIAWTNEQIHLFERLLLISRLFQLYLPEDRGWLEDFRGQVQRWGVN